MNRLIPIILFVSFVMGCRAFSEKAVRSNTPVHHEQLEARIQWIANRYVQKYPSVPGVLIYFESPSLGNALWASGYRDPRKGSRLLPTDQFRCASISKMFIAASVLLLSENGLLNVNDRISRYLPSELMSGISRFEGIDRGNEITIRQCLEHTSGLWDCFSDGKHDSQGLSPLDAELERNPDKFWTSPEVIAWCKTRLKAVAPPGVLFHYSDTGFQLLGLIVEKLTGKPLAEAVRELVFNRLEMKDTYAEFREEPHRSKGVELSHSFDGKTDRTGFVSESADWGGGGWITTAPDLARFLRALSGNKLFRHSATVRLMQEWSPESKGDYGLGLHRYVTDADDVIIGHGGGYSSSQSSGRRQTRSLLPP